MTLFWMHALASPLTLLCFVWLARPRGNPFALCYGAAVKAFGTRGGRRALAVFGAILAGNFVECSFDPWISERLGYDLRPRVVSIEGDLVARVQSALPSWAELPLAWLYLSGYVALLAVPLVLWTIDESWAALRLYIGAFAANYLLALPFYVFFPVQEAAWSGLSDVKPLLEAALPGVTAELRAGSALDNCFPSLHVSLALTLALCAGGAGSGALRALAWLGAVLTAWTAVALGIHWVMDLAAGAVLAVLCVAIGSRVARIPAPIRSASRRSGESASQPEGSPSRPAPAPPPPRASRNIRASAPRRRPS
jgi:membrane-associated phospholipid phosphatase